ncbi:protein MULTIPLE CHLOROPLAST DIVISION SITE 1-like [Olea europaea var. sylvestris]|uniref:protein MULTIPLE CHLOROPLAST DIVISION SITE 1-like n=1 Tax=Olea europaea var. sylvestris TaxID=158386 RepID=UPI000C1D6DAD|nr:protein MULTIPLE CHLOROPLAST DIVISION SITE 1-like [Olea europaea var. sylvestris]XP_022857674.1 protein MULTIPLE CHLOROPLAST DIVISION SITE 1-like [Olea europaea var. sylvestris]
MVKVSKINSTVEMWGKLYRLAPVTLPKEQQSIHQKRRSHAYQWKRPTMFLEGDSVPPGVDPNTVRWIPSNHPFATKLKTMCTRSMVFHFVFRQSTRRCRESLTSLNYAEQNSKSCFSQRL